MQKNLHFRALFEFDSKNERTFHILQRKRAYEEKTITFTMVGGDDKKRRTL